MQPAVQTKFETERRSYERTPVTIFGRCMLSDGMEIPCQAVNISPGDVGLIAAYVPQMNEPVVLYLDHIGRLEGSVARLYDGGFALLLKTTVRGREKLIARIAWLQDHEHFGIPDMRRDERIEPKNKNSDIRLADGRSYPAEIIDISLSGAALSAEVRPALGSKVTVSGMQGVVVRHFAEGIAIEFAKSLEHGSPHFK